MKKFYKIQKLKHRISFLIKSTKNVVFLEYMLMEKMLLKLFFMVCKPYSIEDRKALVLQFLMEKIFLFIKILGLVSSIFNEQNLAPLQGYVGIGHSRYSTKGKNVWKNSQPIFGTFKGASFAIAHNGNLINTESLREIQINKGARFESTTDTEIIASLIETSQKENIEDAIKDAISKIKALFRL